MRRKTPIWARYTDAQLLKLRFRDLRLGRPRRAPLRRALRQLRCELEARSILLQPHVWYSDEWFSPDGVPGIAIPFYLAHPRLERLERRMSRGVEGGNASGLMRILRHEAGHAIDTAYRLRRRKLWRETFGSPTAPYPDRYRVMPASRAFVQHLDGWYAQSHPAEDFAETFAVWLAPRSNWRVRYAATPALAKLEAMDTLMQGVRGHPPSVRSAYRIDPVAANDLSLREYYRRSLQRRAHCDFSLIDKALCGRFAVRRPLGPSRRAEVCLNTLRPTLIRQAMANDAIDRYGAEQLLQLAIERCRERRLWLHGTADERRDAALAMLCRVVRAARREGSLQFTL